MCDSTIDNQKREWTDKDIKNISKYLIEFLDKNSSAECSPFGNKEIKRRDVKVYDTMLLSNENFEKNLKNNPKHFYLFDWQAEENNSNKRVSVYINLEKLSIEYYIINQNLTDNHLFFILYFPTIEIFKKYFEKNSIMDIILPCEFMLGNTYTNQNNPKTTPTA